MNAFSSKSDGFRRAFMIAVGAATALVPFLALRISACPVRIGILGKLEPFCTMKLAGSANQAQICNFEILFLLYSLLVIGSMPLFWSPQADRSFIRLRSPFSYKTRLYLYLVTISAFVLAVLNAN